MQSWTVPYAGKYKLEVWGAEGGTGNSDRSYTAANNWEGGGGNGGYSVGIYQATASQIFSIYVGGKGGSFGTINGGFNGGGNGGVSNFRTLKGGGGGGATDIRIGGTALNDRLIVAGGGGGGSNCAFSFANNYAHGGGYIGDSGVVVSASGGTQTSGYALGQGGVGRTATVATSCSQEGAGGGGGGYWGGRTSTETGASSQSQGGGGSGYIGRDDLISYGSVTKHMVGYYLSNTSTSDNTRTTSTTCVSDTATADCAKSGHGYARITFIEP